MASSQEYLDFIIGQLDILNNISYRRMMENISYIFKEKFLGEYIMIV